MGQRRFHEAEIGVEVRSLSQLCILKWISAQPSSEIGIVSAMDGEIEIALRVAIEAGEVEIGGRSSEHSR